MRVFENRAFSRFAIRHAIADSDLCEAVHRATRGLIDADLGGGVIKQRISRKGEGRSGGFRTLILFRNQARAVFVHGFAKKDAANIDARELKALKKLAGIMLRYTEAEMTGIVAAGTLLEVDCDGKTVS
jgi:hypothetical protein